jgi:hypothetical protein
MKNKLILNVVTTVILLLMSVGTVNGVDSDDKDIQVEIRNIWTSDSRSPIILFGQLASLEQVVEADLDLDSFSDPIPVYDNRCLGSKNYDKSIISRVREGDNKVRIIADVTGGTGSYPGSEGYIKITNPEWKITKFLYNPSNWNGPLGSYITPHTDYFGDGTKIDTTTGEISWQGRGGCPACACRESSVHMEFIVEKIGPIPIPDDNIIFQDDFEAYDIYNYPSAPWYNIISGGDAYVTDQRAYSDSKSLISRGDREDAILLNPTRKIGFEASVRPRGDTRLCLYNTETSSHDACVEFDGSIYAGGRDILKCGTNFNVWYKVRVEADFGTQLMDVYINGELKGKDLPIIFDSPLAPGDIRYDSLSLQSLQSYNRYWDDVKVFDLNIPPVVSEAYPSQDCLWQPNHRIVEEPPFVGITIEGVTDPDGDDVSITITSITSDEPTSLIAGTGWDIYAPDAYGISTDNAFLRAERSGTGETEKDNSGIGNGRVYEITFEASDGIASAIGSVFVNVPHDIKDNCVSIDDGQYYDATEIN